MEEERLAFIACVQVKSGRPKVCLIAQYTLKTTDLLTRALLDVLVSGDALEVCRDAKDGQRLSVKQVRSIRPRYLRVHGAVGCTSGENVHSQMALRRWQPLDLLLPGSNYHNHS